MGAFKVDCALVDARRKRLVASGPLPPVASGS